MAESLSRETRPFIDLVDTLRRLGVQQDLPLPQIAVMGDQSAGKSSVLELISGVPFPRGSGLVTRCATQLVMKRTAPGTPWSAKASVSWSGPQPKGAGPVANATELGEVINRLTEALCSKSQSSFSTDAIVIELSSPEVPDLTLLDLPGIVRTAVAGQDASVVGQINGLIETYLAQERTIVLAVMPSNQDVATIDILERAAKADRQGERTLAVLTKPDLIDRGAEAEVGAVLANRRKPLRLGFAAVRCRSQRELDGGVDLKGALAAEADFFRDHPYWGSEAEQARDGWKASQLGVTALTQRLSTLLVERIKVALPSIKYELQQQRKAAAEAFEGFGGDRAIADASGRRTTLVRVVAEYMTLLRQSARGNYGNTLLARRAELRLFGEGQAIFKLLKEEVVATQPRFQDPSFTKRLATEMAAFRGRELPGFTNSQVFYGFMVQNIEEWRPHVEACRQHYVAAARAVAEALAAELTRNYPALGNDLRDRAFTLMDDVGDEVQGKLDEVFAKEADPYTTNESMLELINSIRQKNFDLALKAVMDSAPGNMNTKNNNNGLGEAILLKGDDAEAAAKKSKAHIKRLLGKWYMQTHGVNTTSKVEDMCTLLAAYWDVATKRLVDNVCMTLEHNFVAKVLLELESACFLYAADLSAPDRAVDLERLFREDPFVLEQRTLAKEKRDRLDAALETLLKMAPDTVALNRKAKDMKAPKLSISGGFDDGNSNNNNGPRAPKGYGRDDDDGIDVVPASINNAAASSSWAATTSYDSSSVTRGATAHLPPAPARYAPVSYAKPPRSAPTSYTAPPPPDTRAPPPPVHSRAPPPPLAKGPDGGNNNNNNNNNNLLEEKLASMSAADTRAAYNAARDPAVRDLGAAAAPYAGQPDAALRAAQDPNVRSAAYSAGPAAYAAACVSSFIPPKARQPFKANVPGKTADDDVDARPAAARFASENPGLFGGATSTRSPAASQGFGLFDGPISRGASNDKADSRGLFE